MNVKKMISLLGALSVTTIANSMVSMPTEQIPISTTSIGVTNSNISPNTILYKNILDDSNKTGWHYSHSSHASHGSHVSHSSHSSHTSARIW